MTYKVGISKFTYTLLYGGKVAEKNIRKPLYPKLRQRLKELVARVQYQKKLAEENFDKYLRAMAELDNFRKRAAKEYLEREAEANRNLISKLLPVLDNFDRALEAAKNHQEKSEAFESFYQGIKLIDQQIHNILEAEGLKEFNSKGEEFDPSRHDALLVIETDEHEPNTVIDEIEKGFAYRGKVLRHARVTVSKRKASGEKGETAEEEDAPNEDEIETTGAS